MPEYFDLYDAQGTLLGVSKERALVHRDGDWHRSIHLWVVRPDGYLVFQRRSATKDTWPGHLTASVGGHFAAGEQVVDVLREAREELGRAVQLQDLVPLGRIRWDDCPTPEIYDRELADVFLWPLELPLAAFQPDPDEVAELVELAPRDLLELLHATVVSIPVLSTVLLRGDIVASRVTLGDFVPMHDYHEHIAQCALAFAAHTPLPVFPVGIFFNAAGERSILHPTV